MIVAGITGGIGSGKTTVAKEWERLGAYVMFADEVAKRVMVTDEGVRNKLIRAFGDGVYNEDGSLNKPHLIREAFEKNRVEELNSIVHPAVYQKTKSLIKQKRTEGYPLFVKEAALLLKNGRPEGFDYIIVCEADESQRIERVMKRDDAQSEDVSRRMDKQPDAAYFRSHADIVISNNGTLTELKMKAKEVYERITESKLSS